jgi:predicted nucleotide-binding protein (sugar kinase/HSP70/actin superfamily)
MVRIGIPRALLYYQYYPMLHTFFQELGAEVVLSPTTTQSIMAEGSARVVADTCLPVKVFLGHVLNLVNRCDYIFIPAIRSLELKAYSCAKFLGLPDMTKAVVPEAPPILDIDIDISKGKQKLNQAIYQLGRHITKRDSTIKHASESAWQAHLKYRGLMVSERLTPPEAIARYSGDKANPGLQNASASIAIIGHPYLLYDEYINYRLVHRLKQAGDKVMTSEMLSREELASSMARLVGRAYWTYEEEVVGAGGHYLQNGVDGVIGLMTFGCGPDSLMMEMVRRQAARIRTTPFMSLTLEEHTAEAGVITRLEAFLDMVYRRKRKRDEICV